MKIKDYPKTSEAKGSDLVILDTDNGTKAIKAEDLVPTTKTKGFNNWDTIHLPGGVAISNLYMNEQKIDKDIAYGDYATLEYIFPVAYDDIPAVLIQGYTTVEPAGSNIAYSVSHTQNRGKVFVYFTNLDVKQKRSFNNIRALSITVIGRVTKK